MRDVEYLEVKGHFNFKALTERAKEKMGHDMKIGDVWRMAAEVFWHGIPAGRFDAIIEKLHSMGLQTEPDAPNDFDISKYTDF